MPGRCAELPDHAGAIAYALDHLIHDLSPTLFYHSVWHTRDEVVPRVEWLAKREDVSQEARSLVKIAAYFHDLGFIQQRDGHERASAQLAREVLPGFGYTPDQVEDIAGIILATQLPQNPHTLLEEIMADADLDVLGRNDFFVRNRALHAEIISGGEEISVAAWLAGQVRMLRQHHYFTATARQDRAQRKQQNLHILRDMAINLGWSTQSSAFARGSLGTVFHPAPSHAFLLR